MYGRVQPPHPTWILSPGVELYPPNIFLKKCPMWWKNPGCGFSGAGGAWALSTWIAEVGTGAGSAELSAGFGIRGGASGRLGSWTIGAVICTRVVAAGTTGVVGGAGGGCRPSLSASGKGFCTAAVFGAGGGAGLGGGTRSPE